MKFSNGEILFYINPFVFTIEKVLVNYAVQDENNSEIIYYITEEGAWLNEFDLTKTIEEAKKKAFQYLENFNKKKIQEIYFYKDQ